MIFRTLCWLKGKKALAKMRAKIRLVRVNGADMKNS